MQLNLMVECQPSPLQLNRLWRAVELENQLVSFQVYVNC
jgi:hypothetical protein